MFIKINKEKFILDYEYSRTNDLAKKYDVTRQTIYLWAKRLNLQSKTPSYKRYKFI